ncbi:MAG: lasso peptide biosynthesis B2 protein [Gemmatimonadaceae bacterium]
MSGPIQVLRKLVRLSGQEWVEMVEAQAALVRAQRQMRVAPVGSLLDGARAAPALGQLSRPGEHPAALRLSRAVHRAASYGLFRPLCLVRAMALQRMLDERGMTGSHIRIGVKREGAELAAHAWVEYDSLVLGDSDEHVDSYVRLADVHVSRQS